MKTKISILLFACLLFSISVSAIDGIVPKDIHPKLNATALVTKSLSLVGKNYSDTDIKMNAFYKEQVQKNNSCITTNEAMLNIEKTSYLKSKPDVASIAQIRGNCNPEAEDQFIIKLQGGPVSALELDVVKNPFLGTFSYNPDESYDFEYNKSVSLEDKDYYVVDFQQKPTEKRILYRGKIFIDKESLAIGKIEYSKNVDKRFGSAGSFFAKKPKGSDIKMLSASYLVKYKEYNGKWYFDYSTSDISFDVTNRADQTYDTYKINSQIAVTNLIADNFTIDKKNIVKSSDVLTDKVKDYNLSSEWDVCNLIMLLAANN